MADFVKPSMKYDRRAVIIESLWAGRTPTDIIKFFGYPISTVYDVKTLRLEEVDSLRGGREGFFHFGEENIS